MGDAFFGEQGLEFAGLVHFGDDIAAADEFAFDVELRDCGPVGEFFDTVSDFRVFEDVDGFEWDLGMFEDLDDACGESALREHGCAFHEEHDGR